MSPTYVPPVGDPSAEVILVGEAPASEEISYKPPTPFVGSAGRYLDMILELAGLFRGELYITNLRKYPAPRFKMSNVAYGEILQHQKDLIEEINNLENPKVIVPLGNYALQAVTTKNGITNFRGSILKSKSEIKHDCLVIPTFHPSMMHYQYTVWPLIVADLTKVKMLKDKNFEFEFPKFNFIIQPTFEQVINTLDMLEESQLRDPERINVIDVETPHGLLSCIGLAWSRYDAISIPFFWGTGRNYWSFEEEFAILRRLGDVLPKLNLAAQNVMFDWEILRNHKILLRPAYWDSMLMHACLFSEMRHNLETITSIYTDIEFYKRDEDEDTKRSALKAGKERDHWNYNCFDCVACLWSIEELQKDLEDENMMNVYKTLFAEMIDPYYQINMKGIPVDVGRLPKLREDLDALIAEKENKIVDAVGYEINVNSYPQVRKALFESLKMTPYRDKHGKITTDKKALEKLAYKYRSEIPTLILEAREDRAFLSSFKDENMENGRFRTNYTLSVTKTGRLSSRKTVGKKGRNLQNVKKGPARSFFIAEEGHILVSGDQKQAEARIVAYYSKDENYIRVAESGRIHLDAGKAVYGREIIKDSKEYDITKRLVHGSDYGLSPWGFARLANIPFAEAKEKQRAFFDAFPGIEKTYYAYVKECIKKTRTLYNVFGRRQIFLEQIGDSLFRKGYAYIPQSSSTDLTKKALKKVSKHYQALLDTHDGLIISVPKKEVKYGIEALKEAFDIPFEIWGIERKIPIEITVGDNWNEMEKIG